MAYLRTPYLRIRYLFVLLGLFILFCGSVRADGLAEVQKRGVLVWGGDQEGGGPYVFPDPEKPERVIGFEVELAELLAHELGVKARFFQGDWDTLPQFLRNGEIDVVLNGYEWSAERAAQMQATRPYYIYELQLLARENDDRIRSWNDLLKPSSGKQFTVSALEGSAAMVYLREKLGERANLLGYDGNTNAMMQVGNGVDDATLQDLPIAIFYRDQPAGKGLHFVDEPVSPGHYVMYTRLGENRLVDALDRVIENVLRDGRLKTIYDKYGLWNKTQEELPTVTPLTSGGKAISGWAVWDRYGSILLRAAGMTIFLAVVAMPLAILMGLFIALGRMYGPLALRFVLNVYVEVLRGTPLMLQLYVIYFLLPQILPFGLSPVVAAIAGLAINYSAYEAEIYRAGLQAVPLGQMDAALALGMSRGTSLRRIIVPQAVRIVIPPVTNDFIALFKDTSICSVITVVELTKRYSILVNNTGAILELAALTGLFYMAMSYPLSLIARKMERRMEGTKKLVAA